MNYVDIENQLFEAYQKVISGEPLDGWKKTRSSIEKGLYNLDNHEQIRDFMLHLSAVNRNNVYSKKRNVNGADIENISGLVRAAITLNSPEEASATR